MDGLTYTFVVLATLVFTISILCAQSYGLGGIGTGAGGGPAGGARAGSVKETPGSFFYSTLLLLMTLVLGVFLSIDLIMFYICFESSLIPMYLLIGIYGGRSRKKHAANILFLMTLAGSLSTLIAFLVIISEIGYRDLITTSNLIISENRQLLLWLALFISFGLKTPLIPFHVWLPEAHTEANVSGSIILAGILLKLASYGFIRFSIGLLEMSSLYFTPLIYGLSTISILYSSISTLRQIDLKKIIAYSSIGHMSIVNLGIFSNNIIGMEGGIYLMIAHGIVSPALFILVTVLYDRFHTRIIKYYRGMVNIMPVYGIYLLLFTLANMAIPFTGNFIGELLSLTGTMSKNPLITLLAALGIILAGGYSIWFQNRVLYGKLTKHIKKVVSDKPRSPSRWCPSPDQNSGGTGGGTPATTSREAKAHSLLG